MYLWDSNILRHYGEGRPHIRLYLEHVSWSEIAIPSVVVAEVLRGRCDFALKATPALAVYAHEMLMKTKKFLEQFTICVFDEDCSKALHERKQRHKAHKRYADMLIAAMVQAGNHVIVTRNVEDFAVLLPKNRIINWIDEKPK
ncbi:MAG: type II toxin-antitoxin system VapC family toxin [Candidatus Omnitrophota bacterium]|jgi:predicted nucleic acid-binding protein|nr:MAG: type II toxin-antitoxin system VapC family toxin [Candidatus Omnitrophota bacterium]